MKKAKNKEKTNTSQTIKGNEQKKKECGYMKHATELPCKAYNNDCNQCPWYE